MEGQSWHHHCECAEDCREGGPEQSMAREAPSNQEIGSPDKQDKGKRLCQLEAPKWVESGWYFSAGGTHCKRGVLEGQGQSSQDKPTE